MVGLGVGLTVALGVAEALGEALGDPVGEGLTVALGEAEAAGVVVGRAGVPPVGGGVTELWLLQPARIKPVTKAMDVREATLESWFIMFTSFQG